MAGGDLAIDAVLVVGAVGGERRDRAIHPIEQGPDLRGIIDVAGGQRRRRDLPGVGVHGDVQLASGAPCFCAVFLEQPFARAAQLQPRTVHQQMHGTGAWPGANDVQTLGSAAQGRVVRHRETETEQGDDGADQPFGLPQCQAEYRSQRQRGRDRQARIAWLAASRRSRLSFPRRNRRIGKPHGQAATLPQGRIIRGRVRGPVLLLWDVVTTLATGFERHELTLNSDAEHPCHR